MSTSLSKLIDNLSEGLHNDKCKDCESYLDYVTIKDNKLIFRYFSYKKNYEKNFNKDLIQRFVNIYEFCNGDLNKFILLLRKGVYPYEYMDSWQRFDETSLPDKEAFYSNLNMKILQMFTIGIEKKYSSILLIKIIHYCLQMLLKILETRVLKYMNLILLIF